MRPLALSLTASALAGAIAAPAVFADGAVDVTVTGQITPGHLAIRGPGSFSLRTRRDRAARVAAVTTVPFTVTDTRGSGAGWAINLAADVRSTTGARPRGIRVTVRGFQVRCGGCTPPANRLHYPLTVSRGRPARVFVAARRTGMGVQRLGAVLGLTAPRKSRPQAYVVTLRMSQVSGP